MAKTSSFLILFCCFFTISCITDEVIQVDISEQRLYLVKNNQIPKPWLERNILGLQKFNGGIEELSLKISQIRTWTYISNHPNWIDNEKYWQETTQDIENNLSD